MRCHPSVLAALLLGVAAPMPSNAQELDPVEQRIVAYVDANHEAAISLLQRTVDINSGTLNPAGVRRVYDALRPELEALGFRVRWEPLPDSLERSGHLVAERTGNRGKRLLLIGHLDTVFEEDSPFQRFVRLDAQRAKGPGVADMKGGNVVLIQALRALNSVGALEGTTIRIVMTGDEEDPGLPLSVARASLVDAAKQSDVALNFEGGSRDEQGNVQAVVARRSASEWRLRVHARSAHSSGIFRESTGAGAIFEAARILDTFYGELRGEENLTFNAGVIVGGTEVSYDAATARGTAFGKTNVIPEQAIVTGDLRTISEDQQERVRERMRRVVALSLPRAQAEITFLEGYPPMAPKEGNYELLRQLDAISRSLGLEPVVAYDPGRRGAADVSFAAPHVDAALDGLGPFGTGSHTVEETVDLASMADQAKRAAVLIHRLTR